MFCTFWLQNVLRATTACTFSTSQLPKVVRSSSVLSILTWKCASRHNGVHFFMSHLASWLRTRRFSEPTFRPSGATNHWKNTVNRDFPIFSRIYLFFLLIFSLLTLFTSAFQLSILSEVSLLNFLRLCIIDTVGVGKLRTTFLMDSEDSAFLRWGESTDQAAYVALLEAAEFSLFLDGNTYGKIMWIHDILWISMVNFQWHLVFIYFYMFLLVGFFSKFLSW